MRTFFRVGVVDAPRSSVQNPPGTIVIHAPSLVWLIAPFMCGVVRPARVWARACVRTGHLFEAPFMRTKTPQIA